MSKGRVAVTGGSGFVGGNLLRHLASLGAPAVSLGRRPPPVDAEHRTYQLGPEPADDLFAGVDALVHCAYDFSPRSAREVYQRNVVGTTNLLRAATRAGVSRIVFISSMSAYDGTRQIYGRAKLEGERQVAELGGISLRLGLVWGGDDAAGMAGTVQRLASLPVVPVFGTHSHQFTVHRDDVNVAVVAATVGPPLHGVLGVANPERVPTRQLLAGLAGGTPGRFVSVPWQPVYWSIRAAEALHVPLPVRADSVLGLVRPAPAVPGSEQWDERGVHFRALAVPA